jgi:hypothetical protein
MELNRLDGSEIRGFTKGLQTAQEIVRYIAEDMRRHKRRYTPIEVSKALECAITQREILRENPDAFVRCCQDGYEVYDGTHKKANP